jgi:predicted nucleotide-binding protein
MLLMRLDMDDRRARIRRSQLSADERPATAASPTQEPARKAVDPPGPIFLVHGHDHALLHHAVRALERGTRREVVVLHEQANRGRTILEKFEEHAGSAAFAVVLLTGDDRGGTKDADDTQPRGRQNVIFELGFFFGKLGRRRVIVLLDHGVEKPSDIEGLVYIPIDAGGAWKGSMARELAAAGIEVDYLKMP